MKRLYDLAGLTDSNATEIYKRLYEKWLVKNSDKVWIDGRLIDEGERLARLISTNGISPGEIVKYDGLSKGLKLTESMFIERRLDFYKKLNKSEYIKSDHRKIDIYISFLENRLKMLDEHIVTTLVKNDLFPAEYEKEFILLINNKLDNKIRYEKDLPHWKLWILIVFFIDNAFIPYLNKDTKSIINFICNHFEYFKDGKLYIDAELKEKIKRTPNKLHNQLIQKREDYLKKLMFFNENNGFKFTLF